MEAEEFSSLIGRHARLIHRVAYGYCRNPTDREDVVQEVALQLWRSRHRYDDRYRETTWIYRIAVNVAISFHRRGRRHQDRHLSIETDALTIAQAPSESGDDAEVLRRALDGLGLLDKALVLLYLDGNDHASIADVLGISPSNVGTKLSRIRSRLRGALGGGAPPSRKGDRVGAR